MVQDFVPAPRRYSKKSSRRVPRAAFCSCSTRLPVLAPPHARSARGHAWLTPLHLSFAPIHPCGHVAGLRGDASSSSKCRAPPAMAPWQPPPQRRGPALTPVDAAPRRLPLREDGYSTWDATRAVLPSGKRAARILA